MITKHKPNRLNLSEIDKLLTQCKSHISDIGESVNSIFYVLNKKQQVVYLNNKAKRWLNLDTREQVKRMDLEIADLFEEQIAYVEYKDPDGGENTPMIKYNLKNVWFPGDLDFKLCLLSAYPVSNGKESLHMIRPLKDWDHLKKRLVNLIEEEEFIQTNTEKYDQLTNREKQVVNLIAVGRNSKDISEELHISKYTVEQHRKNARKKLGVLSLAELTKYGRIFG
ncbi:MAG: helix-turn-helix transcriptional regulator [Cyclobacteriaceae bacterium]